MGQINLGPNKFIHKAKSLISQDVLLLQEKITQLEDKLAHQEIKTVEVIKEVPVEVIREVKVVEEKIVQVPFETIKEIRVVEEKIIEIIKEIPVEIVKIEHKTVEVIKEVEKFIVKEINSIPKWVFGIIGLEALAIIVLLIK